MTVTVASFRQDLPEFGNVATYPNAVIQYWLSVNTILMGIGTGSPPNICSFTGEIGAPGNPSNILDVTAIAFGSLSLLPLQLSGDDIGPNFAITQQLTGAPGQIGEYFVNAQAEIGPENMVGSQIGAGVGYNMFWGPISNTANSPPTTIADFALEMLTAHQIVLEKQAMDAARTGGDPGTKIGIVSNKSVNGVSIAFDVAAVTGSDKGGQAGAGYYNQTIYGMRFWRLAKARSGGPIQIGIGRAPSWLVFNNWGLLGGSNSWAGPYPGIAPSDTGFG